MSKGKQRIESAIAEAKHDAQQGVRYINYYRDGTELARVYKNAYMAAMHKRLMEDTVFRNGFVSMFQLYAGKDGAYMRAYWFESTELLRKAYGFSGRQWRELVPQIGKLANDSVMANLS